ncbi:MAG: glutathione S-transferase family protein [Undibacterium sp.]|nr:glutathione S-transferase family protein [Undibacterium sp.]
MQNTSLETSLAPLHNAMKRSNYRLVIGNKNYSSWSMRAWLVMKTFGIPFEEIMVLLDRPDTTQKISEFSLSGRVPVLLGDELVIWDSLAICEYLAEQFPMLNLWPESVAARATARSVCAEMHSGFSALRSAMPMNIRANFAGKGRTAGSQADIGRVSEIWEDCLSTYGAHRFLFGDFSIADAFFAPVVMRFKTYGVSLAPALQAYCERIEGHPAVMQWVQGALAEKDDLSKFDFP